MGGWTHRWRRGLRMVLDAQPDLEVVVEVSTGAEAIEVAARERIDLAVLDVAMPRMTGLQAAAELTQRLPALRVLMLSMYAGEQYLYEALRSGASGYVLKSAADRDLVEACRAAMRGEPFLYPAAITSERVDRTKVALLGAALVVVTQTIEQEQAIEAVDFNTIGLLAGMMLMVRLTETTGVYTWLAIRAGQLSGGRPLAVSASLAVTTAVLSAFLDNVTTILLMVPITFLLADALDIDPLPLVIIEILVSNIGGTATLIGDPPNILIAGATDLTFMEFIVHLAPVCIVIFLVVTCGLYFFFRDRLQVAPDARSRVMELDAKRSIEDLDELKRTVPILIA